MAKIELYVNDIKQIQESGTYLRTKLANGYYYHLPRYYKAKILNNLFLTAHYKNMLLYARFKDSLFTYEKKIFPDPNLFTKIRLWITKKILDRYAKKFL